MPAGAASAAERGNVRLDGSGENRVLGGDLELGHAAGAHIARHPGEVGDEGAEVLEGERGDEDACRERADVVLVDLNDELKKILWYLDVF
ncbi:hypothetical protein PMKS-002921 [Pichia membranifaciens]|uniref:Uncharacterized protein n=1 Tax=Pichia membranifaciens TaxID=4926 RepID=A0A1Q2YIX2_9ASCO|nr:hypothetical protein PMKS-002921 [Pichia membranifaciens]